MALHKPLPREPDAGDCLISSYSESVFRRQSNMLGPGFPRGLTGMPLQLVAYRLEYTASFGSRRS